MVRLAAIAIITIMGTMRITIMIAEPLPDAPWLYRTLSWMSPAWPIGAFAFSSALEWAHEAGWLPDAAAVEEWLRLSLCGGQLSADAAAFIRGWQTTRAPDPTRALTGLAELILAAQGSVERVLEVSAQGSAFRRIAIAANSDAYPHECDAYRSALRDIADNELPYSLAASAFFAVFDVPLEVSLMAYLHGAVSNLVSAAQRIVPLGHTEAQVLLVRLEPDVARARSVALARRSLAIEACLGTASFAADIAAMRHETQYTRLFRT